MCNVIFLWKQAKMLSRNKGQKKAMSIERQAKLHKVPPCPVSKNLIFMKDKQVTCGNSISSNEMKQENERTMHERLYPNWRNNNVEGIQKQTKQKTRDVSKQKEELLLLFNLKR